MVISIEFKNGSYAVYDGVVRVTYGNGAMVVYEYFGQDNLAKDYINLDEVDNVFITETEDE